MKIKSKKQTKSQAINQSINTIHLNALSREEKDIILNTLSLKEKSIKDIMVPRVDVLMVHIESSYDEIIKVFNKSQNSRIPVYKDGIDDITGIFYIKDLVHIDKKTLSLKKLLHKPYFVPITMSPMKLLREFREKQVHIAIIIDEYGGFSGIVTMEDILEQIVGDINDEFDEREHSIRETEDGGFLVDARCKIEDFNNQSKLPSLPTENADTIGGFIFSYLGRLPKKNEKVEYKNYIFTVVAKSGNIVTTIKIGRKERESKAKE